LFCVGTRKRCADCYENCEHWYKNTKKTVSLSQITFFLISSYGTGKPEHILFMFYFVDALCKPLVKRNIHTLTSLESIDSREFEEVQKRQAFRESFNQQIKNLLLMAVRRLTPGIVLVRVEILFLLSFVFFYRPHKKF
jgi:hypothetical protein